MNQNNQYGFPENKINSLNKQRISLLEEKTKLQNKFIKTFGIFILTDILIFLVTLFIKKNEYINADISELMEPHLYIIIIFSIIFGPFIAISKSSKEYTDKYNKYRLEYKNYFINPALNKIFTNVTYTPEKGIDKNIITNLVKKCDNFKSNDLVIGNYKSIKFKQADISFEEYDGEYYTKVFRGRWIIFDFNKNFTANIQIWKKNYMKKTLGDYLIKNNFSKIKSISNNFNIYSDNTTNALNILTPLLLEKIQSLFLQTNGNICLIFNNNQLHVCINDNSDLFEFNDISKPINETQIMNLALKDINKITIILDELIKETNLFKNINN